MMFDIITSATLSAQLAEFLIGLTIKGSVILSLAYFVTRLLKGSSAALRHAIWSIAMVGVLLLPLGAVLLPSLDISPLPSITPAEEAPVPASMKVTQLSGSEDGAGAQIGLSTPLEKDAARWPFWMLMVWLAGATVVLAKTVVGLFKSGLLVRRACPLDDPEFASVASACARRFGIGRPVRLVQSEDTGVPLTVGWMNPAIVVPGDAVEWTRSRKEIVLLHEYAHIRRGDYNWTPVAIIASILYWFNPLVWLAVRRTYIERERAADDYVLTAGTRSSDYAHHLLAIARSIGQYRRPAPVEVAMVQRRTLEGRLLAILDSGMARGSVRPVMMGVIALLAAVVIAPVASVQTWARVDDGSSATLTGEVMEPWTGQTIASGPNVFDAGAVAGLKSAFNEEEVRKAHASFLDALSSRDLDRAWSLLARDWQKRILKNTYGGFAGWKKQMNRKYYKRFMSTSFSHKKVRLSRKGDNYLITGKCGIIGTDPDGDKILISAENCYMLFVFEDGSWKIGKTNF